eukprot:scpid105638/ scgid14839/ 
MEGLRRAPKNPTLKEGNMVVVTQLDHSTFKPKEEITIGKLKALFKQSTGNSGSQARIVLAEARLKLHYCDAIREQVISMQDVNFGSYDQWRTIYLMYKGQGESTSLTAFTFHRTEEASDAWKTMSTVFSQVKKP